MCVLIEKNGVKIFTKLIKFRNKTQNYAKNKILQNKVKFNLYICKI